MAIVNTLFAYTPYEWEYPPYVNLREYNGKYFLTVRGPKVYQVKEGYLGGGYYDSGPTAEIELPLSKLLEMGFKVQDHMLDKTKTIEEAKTVDDVVRQHLPEGPLRGPGYPVA